jgi:hypothetical protein
MRERLARKVMRISKPATINPAYGRSILASGKIMALTGLKGRLQRIGLSISNEKEKGVTGTGGIQIGYVAISLTSY